MANGRKTTQNYGLNKKNKKKKKELKYTQCACVRSAKRNKIMIMYTKMFSSHSEVDNFRDEEKQTADILAHINKNLRYNFACYAKVKKKQSKFRKGQRYFKHWNCSSSSRWTVLNDWEHFKTKANFKRN